MTSSFQHMGAESLPTCIDSMVDTTAWISDPLLLDLADFPMIAAECEVPKSPLFAGQDLDVALLQKALLGLPAAPASATFPMSSSLTSSSTSTSSSTFSTTATPTMFYTPPTSPGSSASHKRSHSSDEDEAELATSTAAEPPKKKASKRKRTEPKRTEFTSDEAYLAAWTKWRHTRDSNNVSVKRSREKAKEKASLTEELKTQHEREVKRLECEVQDMRESLSLVLKALARPQSLTESQQTQVKKLLLQSSELLD